MGDENIDTLARINAQIRQAVLDCFPCANEEFVTIQMPGAIIDTRLGGSYVSKGERVTADIRNTIMCNEAMLVDSMVPLDKVTLGPTGRSVTRSLMSALDMLVPRKTEIGSLDGESDLNNVENTSKYAQAMKFLQSKEAIHAPQSAILGSRQQGAKDQTEARGVLGTVAERYVKKQLAWSEARGEWDAARSEALEERDRGGATNQSTAKFRASQEDNKRARGELQARMVDWIVNGDKFGVDDCFSNVDHDSLMARIERCKEATRDSLLTSTDGTEWAQVTLEPRNWARLCREKAIDWKTRHPTNSAHPVLRLEGLKGLKRMYEIYYDHLENRSVPLQPQSTWDSVNAAYIKFDTEINSATTDNQKQSLTAQKEIVRPLWEILQKADIKEGEITNLEGETNTAMDTAMEVANNDKLNKVKEELVALKNSAAREEMTGNVKGELGARRRTALTNINNFESQVRQFNALEDKAKQEAAQTKLDQVKNALTKVDNALLQIRTEENMANLEGNGIKTLKTSIAGILISVNDEINELDKELGHSAVTGIAVAESIIVGDDKGSKLINDLFKAESAEQSVNIWKRVAFSVGPNSGSSSTEESQVPATTDVSVGKRWASVHGSTSFSSSSKDVQSQISSCNVNGSFSAMVVKIKRPWLHSDLFQDFDVDVPVGTLLSPGAQKIKEWVEKGDSGTGDVTRAQFGIFPAYPTAFVVAADTALEFMSTADNSSEMMKSLATDSSIQASYGPWGLKCGASATTSSEESSQIMSVQDGSLRISFQAPQIIAWVSEILPQLPRGTDPSDMPAHPNVVIR